MAAIPFRVEAQAITRVFYDHKVAARVIDPPISFSTSRARVFFIHRRPEVRIKTVMQLDAEISEALTRLRGGDEVRVRIQRNLLRVEVPRDDPVFIPVAPVLTEMHRRGLPVPAILLGETYQWNIAQPKHERRSTPLLVDISSSRSPHALIGATTGGGKTKLLQNMILSIMFGASPRDMRLAIVDPKGTGFLMFDDTPHMVAPVATGIDGEIAPLFERINAEIDRRRNVLRSIDRSLPHAEKIKALGPRIVIFVDELADLMGKADKKSNVPDIVRTILQIGRELKIHLILATQKPTISHIKAVGQDKANIPLRICGRVTTREEAKTITGLPGSEVRADGLNDADFIMVRNSAMTRFHSFGLDDNEIAGLVNRACDLWDGIRVDFELPTVETKTATADTMPSSTLGRREIANRHDVIKRVIINTLQAGRDVSASQVAAYHQSKFGTRLNYNTATKLIEEARVETEMGGVL